MMGGILCGIDTIWKVQTSEPKHAAYDIYAMFLTFGITGGSEVEA